MISKDSLAKFKKIYFERYGIELSDKEALNYANRVMNVYRTFNTNNISIKTDAE